MGIDAAFDMETSGWDEFVYGGLAYGDGGYFDTPDPDEMFEKLIEHDGDVWTWNGGRYDLIWVVEQARIRGLKGSIALSGTKVTRARFHGSRARFRDAMALWPRSLAYVLRVLTDDERRAIYGDRDPKETGLPCTCAIGCAGYCSIKRDMPAEHLAALRRYLRGDCLGLLAVVGKMRAEFERADYSMKATVGGSAYATAARWLELPVAEWAPRHYATARRGYYGGRSQVFRPRAGSGHRYDIHSAYPAALTRTELPIGEPELVGGDKARRLYAREFEGVFFARVTVPADTYIPPLPWRAPSGRVCYPIGTFTGTWSALELRYAESVGVDVTIADGLVWPDRARVMEPAARRMWDERDRYPDGHPFRDLHKWCCNSLTGKLAERPEKERVILHPSREDIRHCPADAECSPRGQACKLGPDCCRHRCTGRCKAWKAIGKWASLWAAPFWRISDCGHVHWAMYLTAANRVELHAQLIADGDGGRTAIYCDTDSCYATIERTRNLGPELGQWGYEGELYSWLAAAPKAYRYTDGDGATVQRCKGLEGITEAEWLAWFEGATISRDRGVFGLRDAARRQLDGLFSRKLITRSRKDTSGVWYGDRIARPDGLTYPVTTGEIIRHEQTQGPS